MTRSTPQSAAAMSKTSLDCVAVCGVTAANGSWRQHWPICRGWGQMAEPLAICSDYESLVLALRRRIVELGTHMEAVGEVAGLPARYTAKVLRPNAWHGSGNLGPTSLGPLLGALGLKLAVLPDDEALAKVIDRLPPRGTKGPKLDRAELGVGWMGA
jgi:hypothetical protein